MDKYVYMVSTLGRKPDLVRAGSAGFKRYDPRVPEKWIGSKFLAAFAWGGGDWLWYDDITDFAAKDYITQIDEYWAAHMTD